MNETRGLIIDICEVKKDLLINQYEAFCETIDRCEYSDEKYEECFDNLTFSYDSILNYNDQRQYELLNTADCIFDKSDFEVYINSLLKYNKYNKLNILNNNSKLPEDIIFKLIIEYL